MRKLTLALLLGFCAIGLLSLIFFCSISQTSGSPGFGDTSHATILITSNSSFKIGENGVTSGSGTASDPWIIENWAISASTASGIVIQNTTAYFVVRNCLIENGGSTYHGIMLNTVINGRIENNICDNNNSGIYLINSSNYDNLTNNTTNSNSWGIYLSSSSYDNLVGNICENNDFGIYLINSSNYDNLTNNTTNSNSWGIYLRSSSYDNLVGNTCENNTGYGIYLYSSSYDNLVGNTCENSRYNFFVVGTNIAHFDHDIDNSNLVDGKSIYYFKDNSNLVIGPSLDIGYLGFVRCNNIRVENLVFENKGQGILLVSTENSRIENCIFSKNKYGIYLFSSSQDNLVGNTCENNTDYGIYLSSSSYDNLISNTINSNYYGIYLTSSSSNILAGNVISNNRTDIYNTGTANTYSSNQFNNNITSTMLTFSENTRTANVGDNVSFSVSAFNLDGTNLGGGTTVTTSPSESSWNYGDSGGTVTGWFIPTKSGIYSLTFTVTDSNSNTTKRRILFFVGNTVSSTTTYYFRGISPTHGQPCGTGSDSKTLLLVAPTSTEIWSCVAWVQNSPDEIPDFPLVNLSSINTYTWYKQSASSEAYIGVERYLTYETTVDNSQSVENVNDYRWINENFAENWAMDYPQNWYWLSLKLSGTDPYWATFPAGYENQPSYADFVYSYTTTPIVKSISNSDNIVLLSATAPVDDNENATIVLDGTGSTNIVLDNYHRPFIGYTTTINSDNTVTIAADNLTGPTTIESVAMDITPSSGSINVSIDNWNTSGTYYKKWTENGSSSDITASHTIGDLKANAYYAVKVDGTRFNIYHSNSSGQIAFTYDGGSSTKTFEIRMNSLPIVENLIVEGAVNPTGLTTFIPTFSWSYSDNDNDNQSNYQIQVGVSENDNSMWDNTGTTLSQITYFGNTLSRGVTYYVRTRVKDNYEWSSWINGTFKLSPSPTVTVGDRTIELTLLEAGDTPVIPTSTFTLRLIIRTSVDTLLIYYARTEGTPQIPAEGVAPFYLDISTTNPDAISGATITFNIPKSWVAANDVIPSTLVAWRNSTGTWQTLPSKLVGEDALYYYLEATTSGFSLFSVSGQKVAAPTELPTQPQPSSQAPVGDQQTQVIFIIALGIFMASAMFLVSTFKHHKRR